MDYIMDREKDLRDCLASLKSFLETNGYKCEWPDYMSETELQAEVLAANKFVHGVLDEHIKQRSCSATEGNIPAGFWYMCTITQPTGLTESDILALHESAMEFFAQRKIKVYLASLEKSNIYHIHYLICCPNYSKNLPRDLTKACKGYRCVIERKITTPKRFNGACNYITKRGYPQDDTQVRILIQELEYQEGKAWIFKNI